MSFPLNLQIQIPLLGWNIFGFSFLIGPSIRVLGMALEVFPHTFLYGIEYGITQRRRRRIVGVCVLSLVRP